MLGRVITDLRHGGDPHPHLLGVCGRRGQAAEIVAGVKLARRRHPSRTGPAPGEWRGRLALTRRGLRGAVGSLRTPRPGLGRAGGTPTAQRGQIELGGLVIFLTQAARQDAVGLDGLASRRGQIVVGLGVGAQVPHLPFVIGHRSVVGPGRVVTEMWQHSCSSASAHHTGPFGVTASKSI